VSARGYADQPAIYQDVRFSFSLRVLLLSALAATDNGLLRLILPAKFG
jgi:hypothetical protein